jgi:hypothetical protein
MSLTWTHEPCGRPGCFGDPECPNFPTVADRLAMVDAAYREYSEEDGTAATDFVTDVILWAWGQGIGVADMVKAAEEDLAKEKRRREEGKAADRENLWARKRWKHAALR